VGKDKLKNNEVYFGIWVSDSLLKNATISNGKIEYDTSKFLISNNIDVRKFLENHNKVEKISSDLFFRKLKRVTNLLLM